MKHQLKRCHHRWRYFTARVASAFVMARHVQRRECFACGVIQDYADNRKHPRWVSKG